MTSFLYVVGILVVLLGIGYAIATLQWLTDLEVAKKEIQRLRRTNERQKEYITDLTEELWFKE